jgi:hypothetical protein
VVAIISDNSSNRSDSNPLSEDILKISGEIGSTGIGPGSFYINVKLKLQIKDLYSGKQAVNFWLVPCNPTFNYLIERVKSFEGVDWPETNLTSVSLAEAGFFFDSKLIIFCDIL